MEKKTTEPVSEALTTGRLESWVGKLATDALLLGVLSAAGYCVAFAYEAGYARHFGYPTFLIAPTPNVIVTALAVILGVVFGLLPPLMDMFDRAASHANRKVSAWLAIVFFVCLVGGYGFTMRNYDIASMWQFGAGLALGGLMYWNQKSDAKRGIAGGPSTKSLAWVLLLVGGIYMLASLLGTHAAKDQKAFFFLQGKPDYAVVRLYDNVAIAVRYDFQTKRFTHEYVVFKFGDEHKELSLHRSVLKGSRLPVVTDE
jgi:hypothetical protein